MQCKVTKVLVVSSKYYPEYSGSGFRAHQLYQRLNVKYGIESEVLCSSVEFHDSRTIVHDGLKITRICAFDSQAMIGLKNGFFSTFYGKVREIVEFGLALGFLIKNKPVFIHAFGKSPVVAAAVYWARLRNVPLMLELCNKMHDPHVNVPVLSRIYRPKLNQNTIFIAISEELQNLCHSFGYKDNVWHRPNPVRDQIRFVSNKEKLSNRMSFGLTISSESRVLLYVAKFMPQKNQEFLLDVLSKLPENYELILAGPVVATGPNALRDKSYLNLIQERVRRSANLTQRVTLIPHFVPICDYLSIADIYLFPARNEALGTPMLEALVGGLPVVANEGEPAFRQWLRSCSTGALCPLEADSWSRQIIQLTSCSEVERETVSQRIKERAGVETLDKAYVRLIQSLNSLEKNSIANVSNLVNL